MFYNLNTSFSALNTWNNVLSVAILFFTKFYRRKHRESGRVPLVSTVCDELFLRNSNIKLAFMTIIHCNLDLFLKAVVILCYTWLIMLLQINNRWQGYVILVCAVTLTFWSWRSLSRFVEHGWLCYCYQNENPTIKRAAQGHFNVIWTIEFEVDGHTVFLKVDIYCIWGRSTP